MKTNLQKVRIAAGFKSAKAFAEHIGMKVDTYTGYEQGKRKFTLDKAWEFADALGCSLDELAGRDWPELTVQQWKDARQQMMNAAYGSLNETGKAEAAKRVSELTNLAEYTYEKGDRVRAEGVS